MFKNLMSFLKKAIEVIAVVLQVIAVVIEVIKHFDDSTVSA